MTDLLNQLNLSSRALATHRVSAATASHNIENANTAGYARQRVELEATLPAEVLGGQFVGRGVGVLDITQARDHFLEVQIPHALGSASFSDAESSVMTSVHALDPDNPNHIPTTLANFYTAVRELSRQPSSPSTRRAFVSSAQELSQSFVRTAAEIGSARQAADDQLVANAREATSLAAKVARLNQAVREARATGGEPNDLLDVRHKAVEDLVALTGGRVLAQGGDVSVSVGAVALVSGNKSAVLGTIADATNRGHLSLTAAGLDGSPPRTLGNTEMGGRIAGLLKARDAGLGATEQKLDQLAFDFAQQVNAVHQGGVGLDGTTGRALFTISAAGVTGAASSIAVNAALVADPSLVAASASGAAGDGAQALAMAGTETIALSGGQSPIGSLASMIDDFGAAARGALNDRDASAAARDQLLGLRESASGVSIDEEMIEMTKAQRVFDAVGKVITTTDDMLKSLLSLR